MTALEELVNELARLGMRVEKMLDHETGSTAEALQDVSIRLQYCYERMGKEVKALESWARLEDHNR